MLYQKEMLNIFNKYQLADHWLIYFIIVNSFFSIKPNNQARTGDVYVYDLIYHQSVIYTIWYNLFHRGFKMIWFDLNLSPRMHYSVRQRLWRFLNMLAAQSFVNSRCAEHIVSNGAQRDAGCGVRRAARGVRGEHCGLSRQDI